MSMRAHSPPRRTGRGPTPPHSALRTPHGLLLLLSALLSAAPVTVASEVAIRHWAFQPVSNPPLPKLADSSRVQTSLDAFILEKLAARRATLAPPADRRMLLRRATYDLLGLPPTPEEIDAFESDSAPGAFARVVERLLCSPHYGEQWGRHWLDVVRYADTAGENTDHPLPHAWRYRNWVIDAFNQDKPYDEFIREQIAGDLLASAGPPERFAERTIATGYLAIARRFGHDIDKDIHLTLEDTIDTLGKSVLGLTLGCARCHDHKYDPVSARDYYGLYGIFRSTRFAFPGCEPNPLPRDLVPLLTGTEVERLLEPFDRELSGLEQELKQAEQRLAEKRQGLTNSPLATLTAGEIAANGSASFGGSPSPTGPPNAGNPAQAPPVVVQLRRGEMLQLSILPRANYGADSTGLELEIAETDGAGRVWNLTADVLEDFYEGGAGAQHGDRRGHPGVWHLLDLVPGPALFTEFVSDALNTRGLQVWRGAEDVPSAFVNINTQTIQFITIKMPPRSFGVHPGPKGGVAVAWQSPVDGTLAVRGRIYKIDPGGDGVAWKLEKRAGIGEALARQKEAVLALNAVRKRREASKARRPRVPVAYAVAEGKPGPARLQKRGNPEDPGETIPRKFLDLFGGQLLSDTNASGRLELAGWLTDPANPLTARVMVNRVWQAHFGRGLVRTPNDFGTRGQPPTHPELLDYLAAQFVRSGWSVKALHRQILLSATYQQGQGAEGGQTSDDLLGGFPRRRLTAEQLRDSWLALSGALDRTPGRAHPFPPEEKWSFTQHGPFVAEYDTAKRSVYVMQKRNRRHPFFALFDGADPNASTAAREVTTVPTQALFFLNDPFAHAQAEKFASRIRSAAAGRGERLDFACRQLFGRRATALEREEAREFLRDYEATCSGEPPEQREALAWAAYARVLLGSNELLHVD